MKEKAKLATQAKDARIANIMRSRIAKKLPEEIRESLEKGLREADWETAQKEARHTSVVKVDIGDRVCAALPQ